MRTSLSYIHCKTSDTKEDCHIQNYKWNCRCGFQTKTEYTDSWSPRYLPKNIQTKWNTIRFVAISHPLVELSIRHPNY